MDIKVGIGRKSTFNMCKILLHRRLPLKVMRQ